MRIAVTHSSKKGLIKEYQKQYKNDSQSDIPVDFFAEGDSTETINRILDTINHLGHEVTGIEADDNAGRKVESFCPDLVFNIAEGLFGDFRESYIPMLCERLGIPYTGSDPLTLSLCLNKRRTKEILHYYQIPNTPFKIFTPDQKISHLDFEFPAIIKPVSEGSSKGIFNDSVVKTEKEAVEKIQEKIKLYQQPVILETFLEGDEFTIALWGNTPNIETLPIVSIQYNNLPRGSNPIYSYEAKWLWDTPEKPLEIFQCPARIKGSEEAKIIKTVKHAFQVLGVRDWCRIDLRMDKTGTPNILELNPLPGILPNPEENSCFPKAARTAGYTYPEMIDKIISIAAERLGLPYVFKKEKTAAFYNL